MSYEALLVRELSSLQLLPQTSSKDLRTYGLIDHPVTVMAYKPQSHSNGLTDYGHSNSFTDHTVIVMALEITWS